VSEAVATSAPRAGRDARVPAGAVRIAAIDVGSNSIRQIVADVAPDGGIRVVDEMKAAPRLGAGLDETGVLGDASMRAAVEALSHMADLARQLGAERHVAVATSAVRDARNGADFLALVKAETGIDVRLVDGEEEARLSFRSALAHFELGAGRTAVMDIGGGSLELALSADGLVEHLISLPFGAVRLTERCLVGEQPQRGVRRLRKMVRERLKDVVPGRDWRGAQVIGSGGTFTNLAGIHLAKQGVATAQAVHGTCVTRVELERVLDALVAMTPDERRAVQGLTPARADIIVAGLAVAAEVLKRLDASELRVSGYGIREGLLLESARVAPTVADPGEARERSVRAFAERCHYERPHAERVRKIALQIFDAIGRRLGCVASDRAVLADAALLHDVGYHINYNKHHKHSYHLILHAELLGMSPAEQVAVANVARYHRGARPKKSHESFGVLDRALRRRIERLSAILRVADGFDRGHAGGVARVRTRWTDEALELHAVPDKRATSIRLELWGASRKAELLARVAGLPVRIIAPGGDVVDVAADDGRVD